MHHPVFALPRMRRPLRSALIGVAFAGGVVLALAGALIGVFVLAIGALLHTAYVSLRHGARSRPPVPADPRVIEGEFVVLSRSGAPGRRSPLQPSDR